MTSHVQILILISLFLSVLNIFAMSTIENTQMLYNTLIEYNRLDAGNVFFTRQWKQVPVEWYLFTLSDMAVCLKCLTALADGKRIDQKVHSMTYFVETGSYQ